MDVIDIKDKEEVDLCGLPLPPPNKGTCALDANHEGGCMSDTELMEFYECKKRNLELRGQLLDVSSRLHEESKMALYAAQKLLTLHKEIEGLGTITDMKLSDILTVLNDSTKELVELARDRHAEIHKIHSSLNTTKQLANNAGLKPNN